jgi:hypothetical protein
MTLRDKGLENDQAARASYWSNTGRIEQYDTYKEYCKTNAHDYDGPPDGYWESKEKPWHKPAGLAMGLTGILLWFITGIIGGATGQKRQY